MDMNKTTKTVTTETFTVTFDREELDKLFTVIANISQDELRDTVCRRSARYTAKELAEVLGVIYTVLKDDFNPPVVSR